MMNLVWDAHVLLPLSFLSAYDLRLILLGKTTLLNIKRPKFTSCFEFLPIP